MNKIGITLGVGMIAAGAVVGIGGCSTTHRDAPNPSIGPAGLPRSQVIQEPNGFRNVTFGCFGTNGGYVTSAGTDDSLPSSVFVLANDPKCS